jgi:hypothetical protein
VLKSKSSITSLFVACLLVFTPLVAWTSSLQIDKVEPPHWWVGMKSQQLELMLRAPGINKAKPSLSYPGVKLVIIIGGCAICPPRIG